MMHIFCTFELRVLTQMLSLLLRDVSSSRSGVFLSNVPLVWCCSTLRSQCWMFLHMVIIFFLFDILSFPVRWLCGFKTGEDRLLLRYQVFPKGQAQQDDLVTDVLLGRSVSQKNLALDIITPGSDSWIYPKLFEKHFWVLMADGSEDVPLLKRSESHRKSIPGHFMMDTTSMKY